MSATLFEGVLACAFARNAGVGFRLCIARNPNHWLTSLHSPVGNPDMGRVAAVKGTDRGLA